VIGPALALSIELVEDGDERVVVRVGGEADTATREVLERELLAVVRVRTRHLCLDLSTVDFLDSSGLRALLVVQQEVASGGRQVRLVGSTPMVDRLLQITGLEAHFPHDES
jgi:anti-sigma B factor antagonist